jgi:murein DD-endopeptidase MepM/ murein hydrolase activator NlpD
MMAALSLPPSPDLLLAAWRFAAACAGSLVLSLLLSALLPMAARRFPALAAHRSVWLLAQAALLAVFLLACAPLPRTALAPALSLPAMVVVDDPVADSVPVPPAPASLAPSAAVPTATDRAGGAARQLPLAWLCIYLAGLGWHAARRIAAARRWQTLLLRHSRAVEIDALTVLAPVQFREIAAARLRVRTTDLPISPLLHGLLRPCLVLPSHLAGLSPVQQAMIVEHELTHWRRRDPAWLAASSIAGLLFWFNRPYQRLGEGLRAAVELGCDDAVLAGRTQHERQSYAAALVAQLKLQHGAAPAPAFGQLGVKERVLRMRAARPPRLSAGGRCATGVAALGLAAAGTCMMPAFSSPAVPTPLLQAMLPEAATPPQSKPPFWSYPLGQVRVTSLYGVRSPRRQSSHHGLDFAARRGTPVAAVAAGIVIEANQDPAYGKYVRIAHGAGQQSLMAHLDVIGVRVGQQVAAGQAIGAAGDTGKATGPHLHLEYWQDGKRRNPEPLLANLAAHATPKALAQRMAQSTTQGYPAPTDD